MILDFVSKISFNTVGFVQNKERFQKHNQQHSFIKTRAQKKNDFNVFIQKKIC